MSLFKVLLVQTWFNISDDGVSKALHRDLAYMKFCNFSTAGNKPDAATICRFRKRLVISNMLDVLMALINKQLEDKGMKVSKGSYVSSNATLIASARRPRKGYKSKQSEEQEEDAVLYSDDRDAREEKG